MCYQLRSRPAWPDQAQQGFTIIEILITIFVIGTVVVGIFSLFLLSLQTAHEGEARVVAIALANEKMEMIRNLPYISVGTIGGIVPGKIPATETVTRNAQSYTVKTDIRYIDDPYDGLATAKPPDIVDTVPTDYKQARVQVTWSSPKKASPVLLITNIMPLGLEKQDSSGTVILHVIDALAHPVPQADVLLQNYTVNPVVDYATKTDNDGNAILLGLPPAVTSYYLKVTKDGYTTEETLDPVAGPPSFVPSTEYALLSAIIGSITEKTWKIDLASKLKIRTQDNTPSHSAITDVFFYLKGTETIGTTDGVDVNGRPIPVPVYRIDQHDKTDSSGEKSYNGSDDKLKWDAYTVSLDAATAYNVVEIDPPALQPPPPPSPSPSVTPSVTPLPFSTSSIILQPGDDKTVTYTLAPITAASLHVTVMSEAGQPIKDATVTLKVSGKEDLMLKTDDLGQVFFTDDHQAIVAGEYHISVEASGYKHEEGRITVGPSSSYQSILRLAP